jgi:hypothetical protein
VIVLQTDRDSPSSGERTGTSLNQSNVSDQRCSIGVVGSLRGMIQPQRVIKSQANRTVWKDTNFGQPHSVEFSDCRRENVNIDSPLERTSVPSVRAKASQSSEEDRNRSYFTGEAY